jgi:dihydroorotate dehydrogenase
MGLNFPNRVGLAAGFDKNAKHIESLSTLGFGFIEVGTVTPKPQDGNPQPRLFRLPKDAALINRMGFNNGGIDEMVARLKALKKQKIIIGGNIGKNKITPNEDAISDYEICFNALFDYVDYFVLNVSSPNTPDLRALQDKEPLLKLLTAVQILNLAKASPKPLLLKIAPDLNESQLLDIVEIVQQTKLNGIIATNTTIERSALKTSTADIENIGMGGLSGKPVRAQSTAIITFLRKHLPKPFCIIGVGGIDSAEAAQEKLNAGADLIQIYTGMVYEGPGLVRKINEGMKFFN